MADDSVFALRYAHAFASVVASSGLDSAAAQGQLHDFAGTLGSSPQLREILSDPSVPSEQKLAVLDGISKRIGMFREVRNLLAVIMDHGRLESLDPILAEYHALADAGSGTAEVEVTSARELNGDDRAELEWEISKLAVSRVRVTYSQDPALLGGAVVRIGSTVYDGSVRAQLEALKQTLVKA